MLRLKEIKKDYKVADSFVHALKGVTLNFRSNEFVSILGQSGCGKTTLLNIIGGLDHYTDGDLVICGKSTKDYKDKDWDVYRNHRIGFVFQSYNLIPHQTVLGNVELALTIAGVSKAERKQRAKEALEKVGLGAELNKRPNQLSGGQMQRVAIARALVNNPEILLADEPTGALDTAASIQIMELIREIAGERLVIMVTHNPEIAEQYSTRIVKLQDGLVIDDSNPYEPTEEYVAPQTQTVEDTANAEVAEDASKGKKKKKEKKEKAAMSFFTALGLSARNLLTKKGRTAITSIAGSIGIISVCLVLALSNGFNNYIKTTQEDMLSSNPIKITETSMDMSAIMAGMNSAKDMPDLSKIGDNVYVNSFLTNIANGMTVKNNLSDEYLEYVESMDSEWYEAISYDTGLHLENSLYTQVLVQKDNGEEELAVKSLSELKEYYSLKLRQQEEKYASLIPLVELLGSIYGKMPGTEDVQAADFGAYVQSQYDVIEGTFPKSANEAVLVIGSNNDMTDLTLAQLGFISEKDFLSLFPQAGSEKVEKEMLIDFEDITSKSFALYYNDVIYKAYPQPNTNEYIYQYVGSQSDLTVTDETGIQVKISGVLRLKEGLNNGCLGTGGLYLTEQLYSQVLEANKTSAISQTLIEQSQCIAQFSLLSAQMKELEEGSEAYLAKQQEMSNLLMQASSKQLFKIAAATVKDSYMAADSMFKNEDGTSNPMFNGLYFIYGDDASRSVGGLDTVNAIKIYTGTFEAKEHVLQHLDAWNENPNTTTENQVTYTDTVGVMLGMVETMLNAVTYVLVAFTAISLVVSSVMIGIITYVSVVERTKEIGVLRSLGARKKDIRNLFNAETFIIGLTSGLFGVGVTYLLSLVINGILGALTGIATLAALPVSSAIIMVCVSVGLTLISGLIPAGAAAKKDPVTALRTE